MLDECFTDYLDLVDSQANEDERQEAVQQLCAQLAMHCAVEEDVVYPSAGEELDVMRESDMDERRLWAS